MHVVALPGRYNFVLHFLKDSSCSRWCDHQIYKESKDNKQYQKHNTIPFNTQFLRVQK